MKDKHRICVAIIIFMGTIGGFICSFFITAQHGRDGCLKYHINTINDTTCMANIVGLNMTCELSDNVCYSFSRECYSHVQITNSTVLHPYPRCSMICNCVNYAYSLLSLGIFIAGFLLLCCECVCIFPLIYTMTKRRKYDSILSDDKTYEL